MDVPEQSNREQTTKDRNHQIAVPQHNTTNASRNKRRQKIAFCCFLTASILATIIWAGITKYSLPDNAVVITSSPSSSEIVAEMSKNLTEQLINDAIAYKNADSTNRDTARSIMHETADRRREYISILMRESPDDFLHLAISSDIKAELLQEVSNVETVTSLEGKLEIVMHTDATEEHEYDSFDCVSHFYLILPSGATKNLYLPTSIPATYSSNDQIRISGYELDNAIVPDIVADPDNFTVLTEPTAPAAIIGTRQVAVILVNVENATIPASFTKANALQALNDVNTWYQEASFGNLRFSGKLNPSSSADIFGTYRVEANDPNFNHCLNYSTAWSNQLSGLAAADGYIYTNYQHVIIMVNTRPGLNCGGGTATIGGRDTMVGTQSSPLGSSNNIRMTIHELGHNLGLGHASDLRNCTIGGQSVAFSKLVNCSYHGYGSYSAMGSESNHGNPTPYFNTMEKVYLGWIPNSNVATITTSGTYDLYPSEEPSSNTQLIRIPMTYGDLTPASYGAPPWYYYFELRKPIGAQSNITAERKADYNGVFLHAGTNINHAPKTLLYQLGSLPGAEPCAQCITGFRPGMVFKDPHDPSMTVKVLSWTPNKATISVEFDNSRPPACIRYNPTVSIDYHGSGIGANPGDTVNYTVTVTNKDDLPGCSASNFTLTPSAPSSEGFTFSPATKSWTIAPGASEAQVFAVTAPSSAAAGFHSIIFTATNTTNTTYVGAGHTSFRIRDTATTPPIINISGIANGGTIRSDADTKITATASHSSGISKVEFYINNKLAARCDEPKNGVCDIFVKGSNTATGTHMIKVVATVKNTNRTTGTANLTFNK